MGRNRRFVWQAGWCLLAAGSVALGLSACGGSDGGGTPMTPTPTPTPCTQEVLFQENGPIPSLGAVFEDFSVPRPGRLDVTMDWTNNDSPVGFFLVPANTCGTIEEFNARTCDFVIRSEPSTQKPRLISMSDFTQGNYRWIIANYAEEQESVALEIVLSEGSCPALAGGGPGASARDEEAVRPVRQFLPN